MATPLIEIRRLRASEWHLLKMLRIGALLSDPASSWDTADEALAYDDSYWTSFAGKLASPQGSRCLVLELDGEIEGTVFGTRRGKHEYRVGGIWIDPLMRGNGYGSLLVQQVVEWAKADSKAVIKLWCHVGPQTAFYVKNGFQSRNVFREHQSDGRQIVEMQWCALKPERKV
jgi:GNAT superfamily N-acetyltransferase